MNYIYNANYQTLITLKNGETYQNLNERWNQCDVCCIVMGLSHYEIRDKSTNSPNWLCSETCVNMWIFQNL